MPTRVLDLRQFSSDGKLSLLTNTKRTDRYACLSYCWGKETLFCLTEQNQNELIHNIPWEVLPQTHKDAILVASALDIPFLWIDALCIIQNQSDPKDWEEQSSVMHRIYGDAYLCIAAANARSAKDGFLSQDGSLEATEFQVNDAVLYGRQTIDHRPFTYTDGSKGQHNPLRERGWCFQEHVLSRRVLHFGYDEMFFECRESACCECGTFPDNVPTSMDRNAYKEFHEALSRIDEQSINHFWMLFVQEYSHRKFSNPADRLPAISGLAKSVQDKFGLSYLAGHWMGEDLLNSLAWSGSGTSRKRHEFYRTPSWSWASLDGSFAIGKQDSCLVLPGTEVLKASTKLSSGDPTGSVFGGYLRVKGVFLDVAVDSKPNWCAVERNSKCISISRDHSYEFDQEALDGRVVCWYIGESQEQPWNRCNRYYEVTLIILRRRDDQLYERIGSASISSQSKDEFMEGWEERWDEVTIV